MAIGLWLQSGDSGTETSLTSDGVILLAYHQQTPDVDQDIIKNLGDGDSLSIPSWGNVTESIEILILAASVIEMQAKIQSIELQLDQARQATPGWLESKLYLKAQYDGDTDPWRSQILAAKLEYEHLPDEIWRTRLRATIILTRRYYWESTVLEGAQVASAGTPGGTFDYATLYNADDTTANTNWLDILTSIGGTLPTPAKISIKNVSGGARAVGSVYIGNYVFNNPTTVDPIFRWEGRAGGDTTPGTTETDIGYWHLSGGNLTDAFKGQFGRVLAIFTDRPASTTLLRAAMQYRFPVPVIDIALGEQVLSSTSDFVVDLGGVPIPPGGYYDSIGTNLYLSVKARAYGSDDSATIDWIQVMPSGAGRFQTIKGITNFSMDINEEIVDDGPEFATYAISGGTKHPLFRSFFEPIHLWPWRDQRLRFVISGGTSIEPGQAWGVKVEYRQRRLSA